MKPEVADLRREYVRQELSEKDVQPDPFVQFGLWFQQAVDAGIVEPNAMTLATASPEGRPSARIVLLKGFDERGFTFFTNYGSRKGQELIRNPWAALVFWWAPLERQVRIEGTVTRVAEDESDAYFQVRPRDSQLGAWASPQSRVIPGREALERSLEEVAARYAEADVPRPPHWGGFRLAPVAFEFWQGRASRLHDRIGYRKGPGGIWHVERLAP